VPKFKDGRGQEGPLVTKTLEEVSKTAKDLPKGFVWSTIDILDDV